MSSCSTSTSSFSFSNIRAAGTIVLAAFFLCGCPKPSPLTTRISRGTPPPEPATFREVGYEISKAAAMRPTTPDVFAAYVNHTDYTVRVQAARALGRAGEAMGSAGGPFVDTVVPLLSDEKIQVRREAAAALGIIGAPAAGVLPEIWPQMTDLELRRITIRAMGRIAVVDPEKAKESAEVALLVDLVDSPALGEDAAVALAVYGYRAQRAGHRVPWLPETCSEALLTRFRGSAGDTKWAFGYALYRLRISEAVEDLTLGLADPNPNVRAVSARGLGALSHMVGLRDNLSKTLHDRDTLVAVEAARALGQRKLSGAIAITDLLDLLADGNRVDDPSARHVAVAAADALTDLGAREATEIIARQLKPARAFVFPAAVRAYVASGGDATVEKLTELLDETNTGEPRQPKPGEDPAWFRRMAIAQALGAAVRDDGRDLKTEKLVALARRLMDDPDGRVRWAAVDSYATLVGEDAADVMIEFLADDDPAVVGTAADKLGGWKTEKAADALVTRLQELSDADPETTVTLIHAIGAIGREQDYEYLKKLVDSPRRAMALAAAGVLREAQVDFEMKEEGVEPVGFPGLPEYSASQDLLRAIVHTTKGDVTIHLLPREAPLTVLNFARLARRDFYEDIVIHRVVPGFVAQAGCPRSDGWGGPGYGIPCELNTLPYARGAIGMALAGRDTGGSQFFFTLTAQPHLESNYTVFARVVRGMDVVYRLERGDRVLGIDVP